MTMRRYATLAGAAVLAGSLLPAPPALAAADQSVTVTTDHLVYPAAEGSRVPVRVIISTSDGRPLAAPVAVRWATGAGTATAGRDYAEGSGTLAFPAGSDSGADRSFTVTLGRDAVAETAETVPVTLTATGATVADRPTVVVDAHGLPYLDRRLPVRRRVADLLGRMTLTEKIGQMTQAERAAVVDDPGAVARWQLGSLLSGGGSTPASNTPAAWVEMVNGFQDQALGTRLQIPLIYGIDAVHGHGNVYGATVFPHNVGLGATRDPALVERVGRATAAEVRATGIPWNFAPCLCVSRDERWGRSYESFGEDPALVVSMETVVDGLQGRLGDADRVLATAKHYAGDGDTRYDEAVAAANEGRPWWEQKYPIDQGVTVTDRERFARLDLAPYAPAVRRHRVGSVMPSFSSVDWTSDGLGNPTKMHANPDLITGQLKGRLGFDGFVITDWEGIHQIPDPADPTNGGLTAHKVRVGVNAGSDMFMEPNTAEQFEQLLLAEVTAGRVATTRIDDAVRRILTKKFELGLFEHPYASAGNVDQVGSAAHRAIGREAVAKSQVLLKNSGNVLPLPADASLYVAGRTADDLGNQAGGWTITWQGVSGDAIPGTSVLDGIREVAPHAKVTYSADASAPTGDAQVGVVVVGETPYAEGYGDVGGPECGWCTTPQQEEKSLRLRPGDRAVVDRVCAALPTCVVLVVSGRPQVLTDQLDEIDALVASWLPGSEGAGVADVLFGRRPFTGRLPVSWPRSEAQVPINVGDADYRPLFPFGWGLRTHPGRAGLAADRPQVRAALGAVGRNADGSLRDAPTVLPRLGRELRAGQRDDALVEAILGVVRDAAQATVVRGAAPADWATSIAEADRAQLTGDPVRAFTLLARVVR
ncbi:glycoside hydrolase family 3 protein [Micromonospora auratinigra]|uniref:beta-glucosidase n=1 Tax=Micromonospora auratinigra TaxID=261654 RepID=A0A1A8Z8S4_9ACTN|nr:glycoside hydrolase family 3 protein [Micromonospora auratinigra]SBT40261.1 beta-glucosidase [Micromonospora auratinigra]